MEHHMECLDNMGSLDTQDSQPIPQQEVILAGLEVIPQVWHHHQQQDMVPHHPVATQQEEHQHIHRHQLRLILDSNHHMQVLK